MAWVACGTTVASAQDAPRAQASTAGEEDANGPGTGDAWVDARFADIDAYAGRYPDAFADELARYLRAPRDYVVPLLARRQAPGELYYACAVAVVAGRPCREVMERRRRDPAVPWSALTGAFDIAPGSPAFLRLKRGIVSSYVHWARPLEPDRELAAELRRERRAAKRGR